MGPKKKMKASHPEPESEEIKARGREEAARQAQLLDLGDHRRNNIATMEYAPPHLRARRETSLRNANLHHRQPVRAKPRKFQEGTVKGHFQSVDDSDDLERRMLRAHISSQPPVQYDDVKNKTNVDFDIEMSDCRDEELAQKTPVSTPRMGKGRASNTSAQKPISAASPSEIANARFDQKAWQYRDANEDIMDTTHSDEESVGHFKTPQSSSSQMTSPYSAHAANTTPLRKASRVPSYAPSVGDSRWASAKVKREHEEAVRIFETYGEPSQPRLDEEDQEDAAFSSLANQLSKWGTETEQVVLSDKSNKAAQGINQRERFAGVDKKPRDEGLFKSKWAR